MRKSNPYLLPVAFQIMFCWIACNQPVSPPQDPNSAQAGFVLDSLLQIGWVATEPMIQDPVAFTFDEDGRIWVVEMRGFMMDIEGSDEDLPLGRISVLMDTDGNGKMDSSVIFLDSLVLPRAIAVVAGGALVAENIPLWFAQDTNGDLRADIKTLIDPEYGGAGLPEHSANGLWRGMDNWYYNAKSDWRYRKIAGKWTKEKTEFRGQWGISHDDQGRLFYNYNWSQLHADLVPPNYMGRNPHHIPTSGIDHGLTIDRRIYPIRSNTAVNRGYVPGTLDEQGRLLEFASACSPLVYRGNALPQDFYGNAFVCEPTANLIKRNVIREEGGILRAYDPNPGKEFLASTDERFRPVFLASGPDGALYVADMYRGIIQHGPYMTPYLRKESLRRDLDQPIHMGRIWRISDQRQAAPSTLRLSEASSDELVALLSHENGWYRDKAQQLLVERVDKAAIPLLEAVIRTGSSPFGRLQALWTLEGMDHNSPEIYFEATEDIDPFVQAAAIRLLEPIVQKNDLLMDRFALLLAAKYTRASPFVNFQIALTAGVFRSPVAIPILIDLLESATDSALVRDVVMSSIEGYELDFLEEMLDRPAWNDHTVGKEIFLEGLATSICRKKDLNEWGSLSTLAATDEKEWRRMAILKGMTMWSLNAPHANQTDTSSETVNPEILALGRQQYLTICAACHGTDGKGLRRFAPPLVDSEWVLGEEERLSLILLQGMEGPIEVNRKKYAEPDILPVMPSFSVIENNDLAAIMTYIRREWGHKASPVSGSTVGRVRFRSQGKITPWKPKELIDLDLARQMK